MLNILLLLKESSTSKVRIMMVKLLVDLPF